MALSSAQDYIQSAFRRCGQMRAGYTLPPELLNDGLNEFQAMFDGFNATRTMAYSVPDYIYPIATNGMNGIYGPNISFLIGPKFTFLADTTNLSPILAVANTQGLIIGEFVSGTGIPAGAYITAVTVNTSVTISAPATATNPGVSITVTPDFIGPRPESIIRMNLVYSSIPKPIRIPISMISVEQFAAISALQINAINVTTVAYYSATYPCGVINVWPPLNGNELEIFTWGFLTPPTVLASIVTLPPGYSDVIIYELAKRLWPMCTKDMAINKVSHQWLCGQAKLARDRVKAVNAPMPKLANDFGMRRWGNQAESNWNLLLAGIPY